MRLPRRVPWASLAELEQVCSSIYDDENDINAKIFSINRAIFIFFPNALELVTLNFYNRYQHGR